MKRFAKILSLLLAAGMLMGAASCSKGGKSKQDRDPSDSAEETGASSGEGDTESGEDPDEEEDTKPAKKTVEVRDFFNDTLNLIGYGESYCRVPEIIITDTDTMGVNSDIYTNYKYSIEYYGKMGPEYEPEEWEYEMSNTPLALGYDYFIADDFVSVNCHWDAFTLPEGTGDYYESRKIFNVSVEDGHELSKQEMLTLLGISEDDFHEAVREYYKDHWSDYMGVSDDNTADYIDELNQQNMSDEVISKARVYVDQDGYICFVYVIGYYGGRGNMECVGRLDKFDGISRGSKLQKNININTTQSEYAKLYKKFLKKELVPELGWTDIKRNPFYYGYGYEDGGYSYAPADDVINAGGILSADIDDYNGDGTDDMIVVSFYKEPVSSDFEFYYEESKEIYRVRLTAYTVSDDQVVKTDEYNVLAYNEDYSGQHFTGCLLTKEIDQKRFEIYKVYRDGKAYLFFDNQVTSSPIYRYIGLDSWMMELNKDGKFNMMTYYTNFGSGSVYNALKYDFKDGTESTVTDYSTDATTDGEGFYNLKDFYDECQIDYEEIEYEQFVSGNFRQVKIASFDYTLEIDWDEYNYEYDRIEYTLSYVDGGNLSAGMRK